jgi:SAM-dependent methyltransferase
MSNYFDEAYFETKGEKNNLSNYYEKQISECGQVVDRIIKYCGPKNGAKILELGCAYGHVVNALQECGYNAWGCDVSDYAINKGREKLAVKNTFVCDIQHPTFVPWVQAATRCLDFDLIVSQITLEHVFPERVQMVIAGMAELTGEGGAQFHAIDLIQGTDTTHFCILTREQWDALFKTYGFVPAELPQELKEEAMRYNYFKYIAEGVK